MKKKHSRIFIFCPILYGSKTFSIQLSTNCLSCGPHLHFPPVFRGKEAGAEAQHKFLPPSSSLFEPKTNNRTTFLRPLQSLRVGPCRRPRRPRKRRRRRRRLRRRRRSTGPSPSSSYRSDQLPPRHHSPSSRVDPSKNRASWMFPPFLGWWIPGGLGFLMLFAPLKPREFEGFVDDLVR